MIARTSNEGQKCDKFQEKLKATSSISTVAKLLYCMHLKNVNKRKINREHDEIDRERGNKERVEIIKKVFSSKRRRRSIRY